MTVIYLIQRCGADYECSWSSPIKAFLDQTDAELFALECNEASQKVELERRQADFDKSTIQHPDPDFDPYYADESYEIMEVPVE